MSHTGRCGVWRLTSSMKSFPGTRNRRRRVATRSVISTRQFLGIDRLPFAVELAKVTLTLARELALLESREHIKAKQHDLPGTEEPPLPLDNLDENIICADALFSDWP